MKNIYKL